MRFFVPTAASACLALGLSIPAAAGPLDRALSERWTGAWVLTRVETSSDCAGSYTNVDVHGPLGAHDGRVFFAAGELARVAKIDAHLGGRIDLHLEIAEPVLESYQDGPFTLHEELACRLELRVDVPRGEVRARDVEALEARLLQSVERHASRAHATASATWNARRVAALPADYEATLERHRRWQVETRNNLARRRIEQALDEAAWTLRAVRPDEAYASGFAAGVDSLQRARLDGCDEWAASSFDAVRRRVGAAPTSWPLAQQRGHEDGQRLAYAILLAQALQRCLETAP